MKQVTHLSKKKEPFAVWPDDVVHLGTYTLPDQLRGTQALLDITLKG